MSLKIQLHGMKELVAQLRELGDIQAQKSLVAATRKAFKPVLADALSRVPVDEGTLRDSLKLTVVRPELGEPVLRVGLRVAKRRKGESAHWRWHFVEFGTADATAKPFLRPAMDRNEGQMLADLKTAIAKEIARIAKKRARVRGGA